jgi:hypothetical protein
VAVPEAAVDEDYGAIFGQHEVARTGTAAPGRLWPLGAVGVKPARVCGRLVRSQSLDRFSIIGRGGSEATGRGQTSRRLTASLHCPSNTDSVQSCCCPSHTDRRSRGAERPQVSDRSARRGGKSLAVELP